MRGVWIVKRRFRRDADDRGEGALGYLGIALVTVAVLVALFGSGVAARLVDAAGNAVCEVVQAGAGGECEPTRDRAYVPQGCLVGLRSGFYNGRAEALIFMAGRDYSFLRVSVVDPRTGKRTVTVTAIKGGMLGVGTGVGVGVNWNTVNLGADAYVEGRARMATGDGWTFEGPNAEKDADALLNKIQEQHAIDAVRENGGVLGLVGGNIYNAVAGPDLPDPEIERYEGEVDIWGALFVGLGFGPADPKGKHHKDDRHTDLKGNRPVPNPKDGRGADRIKPNAYAYAAFDVDEKVVFQRNKKTGTSSLTFMLSGEIGYGANLGTPGPQGRVRAFGSLILNKDKDGKVVGITFNQTHVINGTLTSVVTDLPLDTDEERRVVADNLLNPATGGPGGRLLSLTWDDMAPQKDPGPNADPLRRLLYTKGQTQRNDYDLYQKDSTYGASVKLGLKLGAGLEVTNTSRALKNSQFLGAPDQTGQRRYLSLTGCR
jgi:hypothetical protein